MTSLHPVSHFYKVEEYILMISPVFTDKEVNLGDTDND